jgi:hypothetical protein
MSIVSVIPVLVCAVSVSVTTEFMESQVTALEVDVSMPPPYGETRVSIQTVRQTVAGAKADLRVAKLVVKSEIGIVEIDGSRLDPAWAVELNDIRIGWEHFLADDPFIVVRLPYGRPGGEKREQQEMILVLDGRRLVAKTTQGPYPSTCIGYTEEWKDLCAKGLVLS